MTLVAQGREEQRKAGQGWGPEEGAGPTPVDCCTKAQAGNAMRKTVYYSQSHFMN